ncbi:hypothetical protein ACHQM5_029978 [Ranunculus cassubicifolius]
MKNMVDWSQTPHELLGLIAERINSIEDYVRFGAVCRSWRLVTLDQRRRNFSPKTLPWLMFPLCEDADEDGKCFENPDFFNLSVDKYYQLNLPEARDCCLTGSPYGWLILLCTGRVEIYNPLTRVRIPLPQPFKDKSHGFYNIVRLFMPYPPSSTINQFILVVDTTEGLSFIKAGDLVWTTIENEVVDNTGVLHNTDMLHLNNEIYIVDSEGLIKRFDITSPNPVATEFMLPPEDIKYEGYTFYLVELLGEMHMVVKYDAFDMLAESHHFAIGSRVFDDDHTYYFRVFKLDLSTKKWEEVFTLGDYTLFVGQTSSFSIQSSDFEHCSRGCIYFTDTLNGGWHATGDIGIFDLETEGMEVLFTGEEDINLYSCPAWFTPSLC